MRVPRSLAGKKQVAFIVKFIPRFSSIGCLYGSIFIYVSLKKWHANQLLLDEQTKVEVELKKQSLSAGKPIRITIDVAATVKEEINVFNQAIAEQNLEKIIARYPVRETPTLTEITRKLGFQSRDQYENSVRRLLIDDAAALEFVKSQFGTLAADLANT